MKPSAVGARKPQGEQNRAEEAQADAEPDEDVDFRDDRRRGQHDRDLGEAAAELVTLEPVVRQLARIDRRLRPFLDGLEAVFGLLGVFFEARDNGLEIPDLLFESLLRLRGDESGLLRL